MHRPNKPSLVVSPTEEANRSAVPHLSALPLNHFRLLRCLCAPKSPYCVICVQNFSPNRSVAPATMAAE